MIRIGNTAITTGGHIWRLISRDAAEICYMELDVYKIYEDDSESLCEDELDCLDEECLYGLEVGSLTELQEEYSKKSIN